MSRSTLWRILAVALPVLSALAAPLPAVDLAYQLRAGAEILRTGAIPAADTWTFTASGTPWLDQQWGAQVLLALVYRVAGWTGLAVVRAALVGLAFGLLLLVVRKRAPALGSRAATLLVVGAFVVAASALALRPQLVAIDLFAAVLVLLAWRHDRPRGTWLILILTAVWANVHGTFLLAPALCGFAWLEDLAVARWARGGPGLRLGGPRHRMLLVALVATAATVVTPFGPAVWGYVANLASNPTIAGRVSEWQAPSPLSVPGALLWLSVLGVAATALAVALRAARRPGRGAAGDPPAWPQLLTLAAFAGLALLSGRGLAWWPFVAVFVIAPWLAGLPPSETGTAPVAAPAPAAPPAASKARAATLRRLNAGIVALLALVGLALLPAWRPVGPAGVPALTLTYAPQRLVAALNRAAPLESLADAGPIRVWNPQAWGSWLEFAADERYVFALDSRIELFRASVWADADALAGGDLGVLGRDHVTLVVTQPAADATLEAALARSGSWQIAYRDCEGTIWAVGARLAAFELSYGGIC